MTGYCCPYQHTECPKPCLNPSLESLLSPSIIITFPLPQYINIYQFVSLELFFSFYLIFPLSFRFFLLLSKCAPFSFSLIFFLPNDISPTQRGVPLLFSELRRRSSSYWYEIGTKLGKFYARSVWDGCVKNITCFLCFKLKKQICRAWHQINWHLCLDMSTRNFPPFWILLLRKRYKVSLKGAENTKKFLGP